MEEHLSALNYICPEEFDLVPTLTAKGAVLLEFYFKELMLVPGYSFFDGLNITLSACCHP